MASLLCVCFVPAKGLIRDLSATCNSRHLEQFGANRIVNIHFTNSDRKPHFSLLKVFDVSLEMAEKKQSNLSAYVVLYT